MRFPLVFSRFKAGGPGDPVLGGDTIPTGMVSSKTHSNVLFSRFSNAHGRPAERIALLYKAPSGSLALNYSAYIFEDTIGAWFRVATGTVTPDVVTFFNTVGLIEPPPGNPEIASPGSLQLLIIISDPGAAPNGEHKFAVGACLNTPA